MSLAEMDRFASDEVEALGVGRNEQERRLERAVENRRDVGAEVAANVHNEPPDGRVGERVRVTDAGQNVLKSPPAMGERLDLLMTKELRTVAAVRDGVVSVCVDPGAVCEARDRDHGVRRFRRGQRLSHGRLIDVVERQLGEHRDVHPRLNQLRDDS